MIKESFSPEDISNTITEIIEPGTLGLMEAGPKRAETIDPIGAAQNVKTLAAHITLFSQEFAREADKLALSPIAANVRSARTKMAELLGAVSQASEEINKLAGEEYAKLPKLQA